MVGADPLRQLLIAPVEAEVDVEVLAQQLHAGVADLLLDEDLQAPAVRAGSRAGGRGRRGCALRGAHDASLSTTHSMQVVSACTSAGSTAGNIPIRSWLRPSLR